jgi:hypothetical protein
MHGVLTDVVILGLGGIVTIPIVIFFYHLGFERGLNIATRTDAIEIPRMTASPSLPPGYVMCGACGRSVPLASDNWTMLDHNCI